VKDEEREKTVVDFKGVVPDPFASPDIRFLPSSSKLSTGCSPRAFREIKVDVTVWRCCREKRCNSFSVANNSFTRSLLPSCVP